MRKCAFFWMVLAILVFQFGALGSAQADAVGRLTQVEGKVDILRTGQLPAIPVKVNDGVQTGDILRTKSKSKAQITFIDNSTLTISPESRVSIESYMFDSSQNKRNAVIQLFQGLAQVAVSKIFKATEPDFVVKTKTAIMGVRGTDFGVRIYPNSSDVLNFEGLLQVGNILPDVSQLFRRAFAVAYSFGSGGPGDKRWVFLKDMQGTSVGLGKPPSAVFAITPAMKSSFMEMFSTLGSKSQSGGATGGGYTAGVAGGGGAGGLPRWRYRSQQQLSQHKSAGDRSDHSPGYHIRKPSGRGHPAVSPAHYHYGSTGTADNNNRHHRIYPHIRRGDGDFG